MGEIRERFKESAFIVSKNKLRRQFNTIKEIKEKNVRIENAQVGIPKKIMIGKFKSRAQNNSITKLKEA